MVKCGIIKGPAKARVLGQKEMSADNGAWALLVASRAPRLKNRTGFLVLR